METSLYKELSYRVRGFRTVSIVMAVVTVILCIVVGIGCWVLVAGVWENEEILQEMDAVEQKVEVVEGEIREPLHLKTKEPLNKVGRVVQHIAEIDFADGSPVDSDSQDVVAVAHMLQNAPAPTKPTSAPEPESRVDPDVYKTRFSQRYEVVPQQHSNPEISLGPITEVDGVVGVRLQPPRVEGAVTNFMRRVGDENESGAPNNGRYLKNELSVDQAPAAVYVAPQQQPQSRPRPQPSQSLHEAVFETFFNLTNEVVSDIQNHGLFGSLAGRTSEKYMRDTFEWLGDYTSQLLGQQEQVRSRDRRSILGVSLLGHGLAYMNYAVFGNFLMNKVNAIAENNLQARKLSGDPTAEFLDATFWSKPSGDSSQEVLTAATDNWEPQVNKVSLAFIGEILHTLLNMMREFLMKDHVMECLWFMFCEDLNHQAQYSDVYGLLARVNRYVNASGYYFPSFSPSLNNLFSFGGINSNSNLKLSLKSDFSIYLCHLQ